MSHTLTAGLWRANALRRCGCDWPFNWTCEVTSFDSATRSHHYVATIQQSGSRRMDEAAANARAMTEASAMVQVVRRLGMILDQSDPDHESFVDSAADCLDGLLAQAEEIRRILSSLDGVSVKPAPRLRIAHELCHHD
ncbi:MULTISPECIES: methyl-accepting chemotaxis domain-containing protein [unclassified Novosphingobium]|uniref:hypothetical protein n=1 Tax=unclassified Novosphingobium TaxID=2644732 RepID=UPI000AB3728B|nr:MULTISPECIES: hypothetical protein [unclassified Novosphingobium]MBN9142358.1 hypothetical protein [Novosphingobium sp.]